MQSAQPRDIGVLVLVIGMFLILFVVTLTSGHAAPLTGRGRARRSRVTVSVGRGTNERGRCPDPAIRAWTCARSWWICHWWCRCGQS